MAVSASFDPGRVTSEPGGTAALTLRLHNDAPTDEIVKLRPAGELASQTVLQSETIYLDPNETFEVPVIVDVGPGLAAGPHSSTIEVSGGQGDRSLAEATIDVREALGYVVMLTPETSRSSSAGKHKVAIRNTGNTPVVIDLATTIDEERATIELATESVNVYPNDEAAIELRVVPGERFWNGATRNHDFAVTATGSDGEVHELEGSFEQGPRLRPWLLPALVGAGIALLIGTIAWFALLRPEVEDIAQQAIEDDRAALQERIAELEQAAAEAEELPLGEPADLRLAVDPAAGSSASESFAVSSDRTLSVTDIVFQNPTGAVGTVSIRRDGDILLQSELANFRDLDFHFVAPLQFSGGSTIELRVDCTAPGPGLSSCDVAATIIGFVDQDR